MSGRLWRVAAVWVLSAAWAGAQDRPYVHDPSTVVRDGDSYYVYSTGPGISMFSSPDLVSWRYRGTVFKTLPPKLVHHAPGNDGVTAWAPDVIKLDDTFYLYYAVATIGSTAAAIGLATNTTLDPTSAAYHWVDRGMVVASDGRELAYAIDPGVIATADGKLWLTYGSYHGNIELVQLNPKTGLQLKPDALPRGLASESEAADIIAHDGWFYLFVNHGTCCQGSNSTYHINVGRSRKITGPYVDRRGKSLLVGAGEPFLASEGARIGPGHFGLLLDKDEEYFSLHYEADAGSNGQPVLAVRRLLWSPDGWPIAGPAVDWVRDPLDSR